MKKNDLKKRKIDDTTLYGLFAASAGISSGYLLEEVLNLTSDDYLRLIFLVAANATSIGLCITFKKIIDDKCNSENKYIDSDIGIEKGKTKKLDK